MSRHSLLPLLLFSLFALAGFIGGVFLWKSLHRSPETEGYDPESSAAHFLDNLIFDERVDFKNRAMKDENHNGVPEYGTLPELFKCWGMIPTGGKVSNTGDFQQDEYVFRVFLPAEALDAEKYWCGVAVPIDPIKRRKWKSYLVDGSGVVHQSRPRMLGGLDECFSHAYAGTPFKSQINADLWEPYPYFPKPPRPPSKN
jgi:hypothetical protein